MGAERGWPGHWPSDSWSGSRSRRHRAAAALVAGVLLGSAAWWIGMTGAATMVRERVTPAVTHGIGIVSGVVLVVLGVVSAISGLR